MICIYFVWHFVQKLLGLCSCKYHLSCVFLACFLFVIFKLLSYSLLIAHGVMMLVFGSSDPQGRALLHVCGEATLSGAWFPLYLCNLSPRSISTGHLCFHLSSTLGGYLSQGQISHLVLGCVTMSPGFHFSWESPNSSCTQAENQTFFASFLAHRPGLCPSLRFCLITHFRALESQPWWTRPPSLYIALSFPSVSTRACCLASSLSSCPIPTGFPF